MKFLTIGLILTTLSFMPMVYADAPTNNPEPASTSAPTDENPDVSHHIGDCINGCNHTHRSCLHDCAHGAGACIHFCNKDHGKCVSTCRHPHHHF